MTDTSGRTVAHSTFSLTRRYDAAPARVFAAFATAGAKRQWFVDEPGWTTDLYELDFTVGGRESWRGSPPGGAPVGNETVYLDIVPDARIVFAYAMTVGGKRISASLGTVEIMAEGGGSTVVFTEQGAFLDGLDQPGSRESGWGHLLDRLEASLTHPA